MEISAKVLADSIADQHGIRITTMELHYHRYILPEFNTHRDFSRNGASSRAIPTARLISTCLEEMVEPLEWGLNQSGMQAFTHADDELSAQGRAIWNQAREDAIKHASELNRLGFAKQIVNRVIEPYLSTRTVVTSTNWANFDALRNHKDAQPEIRDLAQKMIEARNQSNPRVLKLGEWHQPYITDEDHMRLCTCRTDWAEEAFEKIGVGLHKKNLWYETVMDAAKNVVSAARSARVSYRTHEGRPTDFNEDGLLFKRLIISKPVHASPTEHQATPYPVSASTALTRNFRGWVPFRATIPDDTVWDN